MQLALSVRIAESHQDKRNTTAGLAELVEMAAANGYAALCMRASQVGVQSTPEEATRAAMLVADAGLATSMVTGDFAIPENREAGPGALRNITPYLDLAARFDSDLLRISMQTEDDIVWAQRACDEAAERGQRLAHQCHTGSPFEEIDETLRVVAAVGRANFGVIYEPANLQLCRQDYLGAIDRLRPHTFNVYVQNQRLTAGGETSSLTWCCDEVRYDLVPMWQPGDIDFAAVIKRLAAAGYDGYVTVHQAFAGHNGAAEAAVRSATFLRSLGVAPAQ